jgi:hypothetical protein
MVAGIPIVTKVQPFAGRTPRVRFAGDRRDYDAQVINPWEDGP